MSRSTFARALPLFAMTAALGLTASPSLAADPTGANVVITMNADAGEPGQSQASNTYRVVARVPVACWVRPEATMIAQGGVSGDVLEACNNPGGFTVTANYRPLKSTEKAEMFYGGNHVDLSKSGAHVLRRSSMATIKRIAYRFGAIEVDEPLVLSLTIQPI